MHLQLHYLKSVSLFEAVADDFSAAHVVQPVDHPAAVQVAVERRETFVALLQLIIKLHFSQKIWCTKKKVSKTHKFLATDNTLQICIKIYCILQTVSPQLAV